MAGDIRHSYTTFIENVCHAYGCDEMAPYLQEGFDAYCEAILTEGLVDAAKEFGKNMLNKAGKAAAVGAIALGSLGAGEANAAKHHAPQKHYTKTYTVTQKNLWNNQEYQNLKETIYKQLCKKYPNKNRQMLAEQAQTYAMQQLATKTHQKKTTRR